ncbi:MAG: Na+/H+ antiporter NhaA [Thalassotalea sp.]
MVGSSEKFEHEKVRVLYAPWERNLDRLLTPFEKFVRHQATSGLILMFTAFFALFLANSAWGESYRHVLHFPLSFGFGDVIIEKSLQHWINDGLMTLFFFVVGLELKREFLVGELSSVRMATLPVIAAIGGMLIPALIYFAFNPSGDAARGWGIPMATDIAFALGVIALLAGRVPKALISFLVALAIVDDLGAIVIIAFFYTEKLVWSALVLGLIITFFMVVLNLVGVRRNLPYFILGFMLWMALMASGIHATLAGVISAFTIPALPRFDPHAFVDRLKELVEQFNNSFVDGESILKNQRMISTLQAIDKGVEGVEPPLQRIIHVAHMPVAFFILPIFALFNAGVQIDFSGVINTLQQPVVLGVSFGLLFGKVIGITCFSWLALKINIVELPSGVSMAHITGAAILASIGFTMSIFVTDLAFGQQPILMQQAKLGILVASLLAGLIGYQWLYRLGNASAATGSR